MIRNKKIFICAAFCILSIKYFEQPAYSFIPNVYEPNKKELESTSIAIGKTAAQLIYFGQVKKANQLALLAVKINPKDDRIWAILAETEIRMNKLNKAIESLNKAKQLNPTFANYWFKEAAILIQQGKINNAIASINKGLAIDPENSNAYFQLGNSKFLQKKFNAALIAFKKASSLNPEFWQAINNEGLILFEIGKKEEAIEKWKTVLDIKRDAEPLLALAVAIFLTKQDKTLCFVYAKEALEKNPNYVLPKYQQEQLWGDLLRKETESFFTSPELTGTVQKALANATLNNDS
tara:strand:+ start:1163 stop:2041 length:879 start_codon:yes stop_codon:yes gene_type:complete